MIINMQREGEKRGNGRKRGIREGVREKWEKREGDDTSNIQSF